MSLSDAEIAAVVAELAPRLRGGSVGKVYQPAPETLLIEIGRDRLLISIAPRASRLHTEGASPAASTPTAFAMLLRKHFSGLRLHDLVATAGERIVTLDFGPTRERVVAELTGPHANLFVLDAAGAIIASQRPSHSTTRPLVPGSPYAPPPPAPPTARWRGHNRFATAAADPNDATTLAARVAAHYAAELALAEERTLREQLATALRRDIAKLERRESALLGDLQRADEAARYRKLADLLLAHAHEVPGRGATSATVSDDFEDGSPLAIVLEPALDVQGNAARYYRLHKRFAGGRKQTDARLAETRRALSGLRDRLDVVPSLTLAELRARRPAGSGRAGRGRIAPAERLPYREYTSLAGDRILVGRSAADNDALTFRFARGNDLWLHCRDAAGSHVVVPRHAATLSEATLLDAATLAAHFSPLSKEAQVDVAYTSVKNLRKPKGAAPGLVFVSEAKTIRVRLEPARLSRLLGSPDDFTS
jgi:predicted ribosome quality control (RQC) complex YloA/Tae2 family protein